MGKNPKFYVVTLTIIFVLLASSGYVAYSLYLITSNTVNVSVTPKATLALSANATTLVSGVDSLQLTAHLSDNLSGQTVTFLEDGVSIGMATTDSSGNAVYPVGVLTGNHSYTATVSHP
jgi:hypothetical protein